MNLNFRFADIKITILYNKTITFNADFKRKTQSNAINLFTSKNDCASFSLGYNIMGKKQK
jgi:hypothetical protein